MELSSQNETSLLVGDFNTIIQESQKNVQAAEQTPPKLPRRPGSVAGLKRGPYKKTRENLNSKSENETETVSRPRPEMPSINAGQMIVTPLRLISNIPAEKFKIPELALDDEESKAIEAGVNGVAAVYPEYLEKMDPKTAAWFNLGSVTVTVLMLKYKVYFEAMKARTIEIPKDDKGKPLNNDAEILNQSADKVAAGDYFSKQTVA